MGEQSLLTVLRLSLLARWRRLCAEARAHPWLSVLLSLASLVAAIVVMSVARAPAIREAIASAGKNPVLVGLAASLYALLFVIRRRAYLRQERSQSWLRSAPISRRAFALAATLRIAAELGLQLTAALVVLFGLGIANAQTPSVLCDIAFALGAGLLAGTAIGTVWPIKGDTRRNEESRFVRNPRATPMGPSLAGLSRWPIAKAISWHRPEHSRVLFIIAALSVPVGTPALLGLAILAVWTLASYLLAIVRAVPAVAR